MKSGYHIARLISREENGMGKSLEPMAGGQVWRKLWKLHVQNKIKVFGLRACQDILSTWENLVKRKVIEDGNCSICQQVPESVVHRLWECGATQDVWVGCLAQIQKCASGQDDILQLFITILNKLSTEEFENFLVQSWLIWNQRNTVVYGGKLQDPNQLNIRARDYLEEYKEA